MEVYVEGKKLTNPKKEKWDFDKYHAENKHLYKLFKVYALKVAEKGRSFGARIIIERMRYESYISGNDGFKINNNAQHGWSEMFLKEFPQYASQLRVRER